MKTLNSITACIMLGASTASFGNNVNEVTLAHYEPLQRMSLQRVGIATDENQTLAGPVRLSFDALGRSFELQLEPNANLLSATSGLADRVVPYRGRISNMPGSWARITIKDGMPSGIIWDGTEMLAIEAPGDSMAASDGAIVYRIADVLIPPGILECGTVSLATDGAEFYRALVGDMSAVAAQGPEAVSQIDVGAISDAAFTNNNNDPAAAIVTRMNSVDGIFSAQLGVQINVPVIEVFTNNDDPFTGETNASALMVELVQHRLGSPAHAGMGLTHLWTGKDLDGSTVGKAFESVLCELTYGVGLSQGGANPTFEALIAAHEIGHNFGAPHDGEVGSPCESTPGGFLMAPIIGNSSEFSACSIQQMQADIATASCITPLASVDVSVTPRGTPPPVALGNEVTVTFDIINNGVQTATNVVADITLPNNVSYRSAAISVGSCVNGAGTVSCTLGDIAGSSAASVAVTTETTAVGTGTFDIVVAADADVDQSNNQSSADVTVIDTVDLIINGPAQGQVTVNRSTTVRATLDNASVLDATGVTLIISLAPGLRADSASWSIGSCSVANQRIDCTTNLFAAQSTSSLDIEVTGLTTGTQTYSATVSSAEDDSDPASNSIMGSITVNQEQTGGGGGGGSFGGAALVLLGFAAAIRRRARLIDQRKKRRR